MGLLLAGGTVSALPCVLSRQVGKRRRVAGHHRGAAPFPRHAGAGDHRSGWRRLARPQERAVRLRHVRSERRAPPLHHRLGLGRDNPRIMFITKALGDYTDFLPERSQVGHKVTVEGPYGGFTFDDGAKRQIWIGGGIGITPFIARMKQLARRSGRSGHRPVPQHDRTGTRRAEEAHGRRRRGQRELARDDRPPRRTARPAKNCAARCPTGRRRASGSAGRLDLAPHCTAIWWPMA